MPTGWQALGDVLGGGIDHQGAYDEGRLRTAQTEGALLAARERQLKNLTTEAQMREQAKLDDSLAQMGIPNPKAAGNIMRSGLAQDFSQTTTGLGNVQTMGFRDTVANPATPNNERQFNLAAISGKPFNPLEAVGAGGYTDITAVDPSVSNTPLGESMITENKASATNSYASAAKTKDEMANPGKYRAPSSAEPSDYILDPTDPTGVRVIPRPGGPKDPTVPQVGGAQGAREAIFQQRVLNGAENAATTLENIVALPSYASTGWLGQPSTGSALETIKGNLTNTVSDQAVQSYNSMLSGLDNNLAMIEGMGLAATQRAKDSYGRLVLLPSDTELTRLDKLAEMRQTIVSGLQVHLNNPRTPPEVKGYIDEIIGRVNQAVPFTHADVRALEQAQSPQVTIKDVITQRKLNAPVTKPGAAAPGAPAAGLRSFNSEAEARAAGFGNGDRVIIGGVSGTLQ